MTCIDAEVKKYPLLKGGDILTVRVGEGVGNTSVVTPEFAGHSYSDNVISFRVKDIDPYFLIVFLNSQYGYSYLERVSKGSARSLISSENIYSIRVPNLGKEIDKFCKANIFTAATEIQKSESLYYQAEDLLLEELGLKDFKIEEDLSYSVNLSDIKNAHRADAEYFQPKYDRLIKHLKSKFSLEQLNHLANKQERKIKPNSLEIYKYIEISDIKTDIGEVHYTERPGADLPPNARIPITGGELIISKVRPTRKAIAIIPIDLGNKTICSSAFTVYNLPTPLKEYIFITLRSIIGLFQLEKPTTGTEYPTLNDKDIENLLIPILPDSIQQKIATLVQQSHEARKKAKELLEEAKQKVENLIEANK